MHGGGVLVPGYADLDYAGWLVSDSSRWLSDAMRLTLLHGIAFLGAWRQELPADENQEYEF